MLIRLSLKMEMEVFPVLPVNGNVEISIARRSTVVNQSPRLTDKRRGIRGKASEKADASETG